MYLWDLEIHSSDQNMLLFTCRNHGRKKNKSWKLSIDQYTLGIACNCTHTSETLITHIFFLSHTHIHKYTYNTHTMHPSHINIHTNTNIYPNRNTNIDTQTYTHHTSTYHTNPDTHTYTHIHKHIHPQRNFQKPYWYLKNT